MKSENIFRKRVIYLGVFVLLLIVEVCIALFVKDRFVRPYIGDVLVVMVVYAFVRIFFPSGVGLLPLYVFLFALSVEIAQYFHIVSLLGLEGSRVVRVIVGGVFDWADVLCYGVGCGIIWGARLAIKARKGFFR